MIVKCYKNGTFSKIPEFVQFYHTLKYSRQRAIVLAQIHRLKMIYYHSENRDDPFPEELILNGEIVEKCLLNDNRERILAEFPREWSTDLNADEEVSIIKYLYYSLPGALCPCLPRCGQTYEITRGIKPAWSVCDR